MHCMTLFVLHLGYQRFPVHLHSVNSKGTELYCTYFCQNLKGLYLEINQADKVHDGAHQSCERRRDEVHYHR